MSKIEVRLNPDTPPTGTDLSVVNAARRSFNTRSDWDGEWLEDESGPYRVNKLKDKDKRLIEFLARGMTADDFDKFVSSVAEDGQEAVEQGASMCWQDLIEKLWQWRNTPTHDTPFNHTFISFEVKAPIFVRAQLVKHEYLIMSEFSRRYITEGIEFYEPDYWRKAAPNKKQGSLEEPVDLYQHTMFENGGIIWPWMLGEEMEGSYAERSVELFNKLIEAGVAPEQARMVLPQSTMTEWTWSGTLGAFAKACTLRLHPDAQYESRLVMHKVYNYLEEFFPVSAKALVYGPDT